MPTNAQLAYPGSLQGGFGGNFPAAQQSRPQPMLDADPEDGIVSVAYGLKEEVVDIRAKFPAPDTRQYIHRGAARAREKQMLDFHPSEESDVCGWVMATSDANGSYGGAHPENDESSGTMNLHHNDFRLVYQCVSGTSLMHWASQEDFKLGIYGARRAPRALAWWDLRKAYDIVVELGDPDFDVAAATFTVLMHGGNLSFAIEGEKDTPIWYNAVRSVIQDYAWYSALKSDNQERKRKRWAAICGTASALIEGRPLGERALAILFHCYDTDMDCTIRLGEIMVLIVELTAGLLKLSGIAEGQAGMEIAVQSAESRLPKQELFERALCFRRRCDQSNDGKIDKSEFVHFAPGALVEAVAPNE
eukprot:TRINITY_DN6589_c0_g1_i1.p1 TRINITY_DN6589_c0_g1~~TRINITY_DN6589_c0_g1_i1.p1  ORF type:complete len:419 (-),score=69.50 TRINITY_DN6589_c0_g1_i1:72-1154(-)